MFVSGAQRVGESESLLCMQVGISSVLFWMDLESEISVLESVENNGRVDNVSAVGNLGDLDEAKVQNNGYCVEENSGPGGSPSETKGKKSEILGSVSLPPSVIDRDVSPSSTMTKKGGGLKKWRRIKREPNKVGDSSVQTGSLTINEVLNLGGNSGKRVQFDPERKQRSDGSVSSTNAILRSSDDFALLDDSGLQMRPSFSAWTDLGNREDQRSKSSTTESSPRVRGEAPTVVGFLHDKRRIPSLSVKDLTHSVRRGMQGKGKIDTGKKSKGGKVKIEKENSHSSTESDSRSYNFVFMHGMPYTRNGIRTEKSIDYNEESGDEDQGIEHRLSNGLHNDFHKNGEGGYKDALTEDVGADSSWETKDDRSQNNGSSMNMDPLAESIFGLQSVGEMLEKEVLKLREIGKDLTITDLVQDLSFIEPVNIDVETEIEDLFKRKIEAEVECLAISRTVQKLRDAVDHVTILEEQKTLPSDTVKKDVVLEKEAKRLETFCEDTASADDMLKLQTRVGKYMSCFSVQLVLLVVVLVIFIFQESPKYNGVVPT
ncbi:WPP domain-interacting protein 1-like isoform X2 [Primulina tabacum]|uniref:WPP domain-interacting protein 1-like isoform X2 n=1 Tax=Primulina tabacum TaxID=48773 RepID=UPI003F594EB9